MSWADCAITIILAAAAIGGLAQGFFRTACSLIGLIFGLSLAAWNYQHIAAVLMPLVRVAAIADTIAFLLIAMVVMAAFNLLGTMLGRAFRWLGLGCLDTLGGGVLGFMQGMVVVTFLILVTVAFYPRAPWLTKSRLPRHFFGAVETSTTMVPGLLAERIYEGLRLLEQESSSRTPSGKSSTYTAPAPTRKQVRTKKIDLFPGSCRRLIVDPTSTRET